MMLPWNVEDLTFDATRFGGKARLFPLPDLVLFPHVMQPLHIFESRYREMLNASLDGDGLIAMSMLAPGWEPDYDSRPALMPYACLGKIVTHQRTPEGHYNLLLLGLRRVRIERELPPLRSYREAEVTVLEDFCSSHNDADRLSLQAALTEKFEETLPAGHPTNPAFQELLSSEIPLSVLTDLVSFAASLDLQTKCELLGTHDVDLRAKMLLEALDSFQVLPEPPQPKRRVSYLPPFSTN
jgi:ATP-dependent Lon protease